MKSSLKKCARSYPDTWSQKQDLNPHLSIPIYYSSITTSCGLEIITSENANEMQPGFLGSSLFLIYIKTYIKLNNLLKAESFLWQKGKPERYEAWEDLDGLLLSLKIEGLHERVLRAALGSWERSQTEIQQRNRDLSPTTVRNRFQLTTRMNMKEYSSPELQIIA